VIGIPFRRKDMLGTFERTERPGRGIKVEIERFWTGVRGGSSRRGRRWSMVVGLRGNCPYKGGKGH
jgi:hypothetical protein